VHIILIPLIRHNKVAVTMEDELPSPAPLPVSNSRKAIKILKVDDVLLGRGPGLSQFEGNLRFRKLIEERREEYVATTIRKEKKRIAKEVFDVVKGRGGRFLKQDVSSVDYNADWYEADDSVSIEKTKQALREHREPTISGRKRSQDESAMSTTTSSVDSEFEILSSFGVSESSKSSPSPSVMAPNDVSCSSLAERAYGTKHPKTVGGENEGAASAALPRVDGDFASTLIPPSSLTATSHPLVVKSNVPLVVDPRLLLFRGTPLLFQQQPIMPQRMETTPILSSPLLSTGTLPPELQREVTQTMSMNIAAQVARQRYLADSAMYSMLQDFARLQTHAFSDQADRQALEAQLAETLVVDQKENGIHAIRVGKTPGLSPTKPAKTSASEEPSCEKEEEQVAAFLLSSLAVVDRPVMTEEEEAIEKANVTNEERASILSDAFGDMCTVAPHHSKKAKTDLDENSIKFLVRQMVLEIENIPASKKPSLLEALSKGRAEEFSDKRLEKFLRCEGMNIKVSIIV